MYASLTIIFFVSLLVSNCAHGSLRDNFFQYSKSILTIIDFVRPAYSNISTYSDFIGLKTGKYEPAIWHYSGQIRNLMTGNEIVSIEGLEFAKCLNFQADIEKFHSSKYLSRKCFFYCDSTNSSNPLKQFRMGTVSPLRKVKYMKEMSELITISKSLDNSSPAKNPVGSFGTNICIEFPGGRQLQTNKISFNTQTPSGLLGVLNRFILRHQSFEITNFVRGTNPRTKKYFHHKWISFAPQSLGQGKTNEYYNIRSVGLSHSPIFGFLSNIFAKKSHTALMTYRRYGEAPSWLPGIIQLHQSQANGLYGYQINCIILNRQSCL
jgi:hypothetical protein